MRKINIDHEMSEKNIRHKAVYCDKTLYIALICFIIICIAFFLVNVYDTKRLWINPYAVVVILAPTTIYACKIRAFTHCLTRHG